MKEMNITFWYTERKKLYIPKRMVSKKILVNFERYLS